VVLTVDPQLIIPEERLYVRVEDTVVITEDGIDTFTEEAPYELDEIEAMMRSSDGKPLSAYERLWEPGA